MRHFRCFDEHILDEAKIGEAKIHEIVIIVIKQNRLDFDDVDISILGNTILRSVFDY